MESKKIKEVVDGLLDDEAEIMAGLLALRKPQRLDPFAERAQGRPLCPACGVAMSKNGKDQKHQKWICPSCHRTSRSCDESVAKGTKHTARVWLRAIACELHRLTIRETAEACEITRATAFYVRHKMQAALSEVLSRAELGGRVEMDWKFFRINLKGTKARDMPRKSKERVAPAPKGERRSSPFGRSTRTTTWPPK